MIGTTLSHYRITAKLGEGGMGEVYRAHDERLDRDVAIKVLPEEVAQDEARLARFEREAKLLASLSHQNIATLYGLEEVELPVKPSEREPSPPVSPSEGRDASKDVILRSEATKNLGGGALSDRQSPLPDPSTPPSLRDASAQDDSSGVAAPEVATRTIRFLVMELAEGETLAERIKKGAIPVDDALPIALQIAEGLEAAHEQGIIHRDLKPANVMLSPDGKIKILDFGLAKAWQPDEGDAELTHSPTLTAQMTAAGVLLGTAAYMSPEQARGKPVDKRADIWAFGCVLFEMLTGKRLFTGTDVTETLAAVLRDGPDWMSLPKGTPHPIRRLLRRCLEKTPEQRLRDLGDARLELEDAAQVPEGRDRWIESSPAGRRREHWAIGTAVAGALVALGVIVAWTLRPVEEHRRIELEIAAPPGTTLSTWRRAQPLISPDGRHIVFSAVGDAGERLWLRPLDNVLGTRPLDGTDDAVVVFWSPDSEHIAFESTSKADAVQRLGVDGGRPQLLAADSFLGGGSWNLAGDVLVSPFWGPIHRVSVIGGAPEQLTTLNASRQEIAHLDPQFLPDGQQFLFFVESRDTELRGTYAASLDSPDSKTLILAGSRASYASPGYLLYPQQGSLLAQRFDAERLERVGAPATIADQIAVVYEAGQFSTSDNGILTYRTPVGGETRLTWFDRKGTALGVLPLAGGGQNPELSPDETRLAFESYDLETGWRDIWIWEFEREVATKITTHPSNDSDPLWSGDGRSLIFSSRRRGYPSLHRKDLGSSGAPEMLLEAHDEHWPMSWSRDGRHVIYARWSSEDRKGKLWLFSLEGDREPVRLLDTDFQELSGRFSPDGNWMAYVTDESGRKEVYIEPFPQTGARWQVSVAGGRDARWRGDGREIYYLDPNGDLMAVALRVSGALLEVEAPQVLFRADIGGPAGVGVRSQYAVSSDGQRFLFNTASGDRHSSRIIVVLNWTHGLER
jgi:serine/threonine protein kinase/Tol biopolymer transport system component